MESIFKAGQANQPTFLLLHGTGGDEKDLLPIANYLNPHASILSLRGDVSENGALRFFKRKAEGLFDLEDLERRGQSLRKFIIEQSIEKGFSFDKLVLVGFSNGANMAINLMLQEDSPFRQAILMAPMYPLEPGRLETFKQKRQVFMSMGQNDPIVSLVDSQHVIKLFEERQAEVTIFWVQSHHITKGSLQAGKDWLENLEN